MFVKNVNYTAQRTKEIDWLLCYIERFNGFKLEQSQSRTVQVCPQETSMLYPVKGTAIDRQSLRE